MAGEEVRAMTEAEWLAFTHVFEFRPAAIPGCTPRKFWLFMAAALPQLARRHFCKRCIWLVPMLEFASEPTGDFPLDSETLDRLHPRSETDYQECHFRPAWGETIGYLQGISTIDEAWYEMARYILWHNERRVRASSIGIVGAERVQVAIRAENQIVATEEQGAMGSLRDIFGNPFRPVTLDPACRTSNVLSLAQTIYDERAFDRMPILADALEDGGCTNAEILQHCRQPGEHVRGCWVVDLLLRKE
jgi:hypothetical protein